MQFPSDWNKIIESPRHPQQQKTECSFDPNPDAHIQTVFNTTHTHSHTPFTCMSTWTMPSRHISFFIFTSYNQCHNSLYVYHADERRRECFWMWHWWKPLPGVGFTALCVSVNVIKRVKAREKDPTQPFCKRWLCSCQHYSSLCMSIFVHSPDRKFSRHELSDSLMNICKDIYKYLNYFSCRLSTVYMLNPYLLKCWCSIKTVATCSTIYLYMSCTNTRTHRCTRSTYKTYRRRRQSKYRLKRGSLDQSSQSELSIRVHSVKIIESQGSSLMLREKALPTEKVQKPPLCSRACVLSLFERLLSGFLFIYISKKINISNDKTERSSCLLASPSGLCRFCLLFNIPFIWKEVTFAA